MEHQVVKGHNPVLLHTPPSTLTLQENTFPALDDEPRQSTPKEDHDQPGSSDGAAAPDWFRHMGLPTSEGQAIVTPVQELSIIKKKLSQSPVCTP